MDILRKNHREGERIKVEGQMFEIDSTPQSNGRLNWKRYILRKVKNIKRTRDQELQILNHAKYYHSPITDLSGFNKYLKECGIIEANQKIHKKTVARLLNY